jgi:hypothetical protein
MVLEASFSEVDVVLDATEDFIVDEGLVAEIEDGKAVHLERLQG